MAIYDPSRRTVILRIVYDGLGTAGKTTNIQQIFNLFTLARQGDVVVPEEYRGRTLYFDWLELDAGFLDEYRVRIQVITVPGQFAYAQRRWTLLRSPDAVVEVCDSTPEALSRSRYAVRFLQGMLAAGACPDVPIIVQANKQDAPDALNGEALAHALGLDPDVRVVEAVAREGTGVRATLVLALLAARERVRRQISAHGIESLEHGAESAEALYQRMREVEDGGLDQDGALLVERMLNEG
ncbi:MAG: GTPase domain-containing protein [Polyangiales bacterium]